MNMDQRAFMEELHPKILLVGGLKKYPWKGKKKARKIIMIHSVSLAEDIHWRGVGWYPSGRRAFSWKFDGKYPH